MTIPDIVINANGTVDEKQFASLDEARRAFDNHPAQASNFNIQAWTVEDIIATTKDTLAEATDDCTASGIIMLFAALMGISYDSAVEIVEQPFE